jgi:hypothetical protein
MRGLWIFAEVVSEMEKAVMKINKVKSGDYEGTLFFPDGKIMKVPKGFSIDESHNGRECEVLKEKGLIKKIAVDGKELSINPANPTRKTPQKSKRYQQGNELNRYSRTANNNQNDGRTDQDRPNRGQRTQYNGPEQGAQQNFDIPANAPYNFIKLPK